MRRRFRPSDPNTLRPRQGRLRQQSLKESENTMSKYRIEQSSDKQFYFNLIASNGEKILTSELYTTPASARDGIGAVRENAGIDARPPPPPWCGPNACSGHAWIFDSVTLNPKA